MRQKFGACRKAQFLTAQQALANYTSLHPVKHQEVPVEKLLTVSEFCEQNGVGRSTVYRENAAGRLPFRKIGRATRIAQDDAQKWQENLVVSGGGDPAL